MKYLIEIDRWSSWIATVDHGSHGRPK